MADAQHRLQGIADLAPLLYLYGIQDAVICPGSRNAPLINSFATFGKIKCISLVDERSAGYFALGLSLQTDKPVALICTSGTAAVNFYPALVEAFYLGIPLVAITADRPAEWIDQADGQTIRQNGLYSNHIKYETSLPVDTVNPNDLKSFRISVFNALNKATEPKRGPVHMNIPLREPLYEILPESSSDLKATKPDKFLKPNSIVKYREKWNSSAKKIILIGAGKFNQNFETLANKFADLQDTIVIAENIGNVYGENIIYNPESVFASITKNEAEIFTPDILVTIGEIVVSKRMKLFLRNNKAKEHWHIDEAGQHVDTYQNLTSVIKINNLLFLHDLYAEIVENESDFSLKYLQKKKFVESLSDNFLQTCEFSDLNVTSAVISKLSQKCSLHLANSSAVRLSQLFKTKPNILYYSNRGTSGIDGCVSTAAGFAHHDQNNTFLICGDLSFIYDSNALWNGNMPSNLKIIVLNNGGGNIFQMIKSGDSYPRIAPYLETHHNVKIEFLVKAFGLKHFYADNEQDFNYQWDDFYNFDATSVFEVRTDMEKNTEIFEQYFRQFIN